jgi:OOP family OmpA-OmpF porin
MTLRRLPTLLLSTILASLLSPVVSYAEGTPEIPPPPPPRARTAAPDPAADPAPASAAAPGTAAQEEAPPAPEARIGLQAEEAPVETATTAAPRARSAGRLAVSPSGETGLLRIASAENVDPGLLRLSFALDFFSASSFIQQSDDASRVGGTLALSYSPIEHLELWLNTRAVSTRNAASRPQLIQSQGDLALGVKGSYPIADIATLGVDGQLTFLSGVGANTVDFGSTELRVRALLTSDLMKATERIPVRAHLNVGVTVDNSSKLVPDLYALSRAEQFALGMGGFDRFGLGIGIEVPVKYVTPFLEYSVEIPLGYLATPGIVIGGAGLAPAQAGPPVSTTIARPALQLVAPQRITPGLRITAIPNLTLDVAVEIGLTPEVAAGVPGVPPYNVVMMASYPIDLFAEKESAGPPIAVPVLIPEPVETPPPPKGRVAGTVKSKGDQRPVAGAVVSFDRAPPVATTDAGRFESHDLSPGKLQVKVAKEGFEPASVSLDLGAETAELAVALQPLVKDAKVRGRVTDGKDAGLAGATVTLVGASTRTVKTGAGGTFELEATPGKYELTVEKEGFLTKSRSVELAAGETTNAELVIRKRPKQSLVEVKAGRILLRGQVHFVTGEARLAPDAAALLDNLVDLLVASKEIKRVRVEGHTDNVGSEDANKQLSRARAEAVVEYLAEQGIERARLESEGFGSERPVAPNLTRRGREQNRRVEFHIVEK